MAATKVLLAFYCLMPFDQHCTFDVVWSMLTLFVEHLVVIHLLFVIFNFPTSTSLDLVVKLVHYIGLWLCIVKLMGLCTHANQLIELMGLCMHALDLFCLKLIFIIERTLVWIIMVIVFLWLRLAWRFNTCANGKHQGTTTKGQVY